MTVKKRSVAVLQGLSGEIPAGKLTVVLGPNGAGKSTLCRALAGLEKFSGQSLFFDAPLQGHSSTRERARSLAYLAQKSLLQFPLLVHEVVELGLLPHSVSKNQQQQSVRQASRITGIEQFLYVPYPQLSGGQQARVDLARVICQLLPSLAENTGSGAALIADEPAAALDVAQQLNILTQLKILCQRGLTIVLVLHDINLALRFADYVLLLAEGRLVRQGAISDVLTKESLASVYGLDAEFHASRCQQFQQVTFTVSGR